MNQHITKLVRQALKECVSTPVESVIASRIDDHGIVEIPNTFAEKFAELIVRECMNISKHNIYEPDYRGGSQILEASENYRANCRAKDIFNQIVEHFGVEE